MIKFTNHRGTVFVIKYCRAVRIRTGYGRVEFAERLARPFPAARYTKELLFIKSVVQTVQVTMSTSDDPRRLYRKCSELKRMISLKEVIRLTITTCVEHRFPHAHSKT